MPFANTRLSCRRSPGGTALDSPECSQLISPDVSQRRVPSGVIAEPRPN
jgi:hypothetical protein